ncbi:unnamed protein product [Rangifer tarandus platyrhynchus]|uniref:Uncharacterized protein n=1 Tax=Rangifer tarandus platyrhynchus TaxID=3082113 RepID=A0ABN9A742_RANTA|nr:unnamed protein product [Rangifer tarandus platyrhynchus]
MASREQHDPVFWGSHVVSLQHPMPQKCKMCSETVLPLQQSQAGLRPFSQQHFHHEAFRCLETVSAKKQVCETFLHSLLGGSFHHSSAHVGSCVRCGNTKIQET